MHVHSNVAYTVVEPSQEPCTFPLMYHIQALPWIHGMYAAGFLHGPSAKRCLRLWRPGAMRWEISCTGEIWDVAYPYYAV